MSQDAPHSTYMIFEDKDLGMHYVERNRNFEGFFDTEKDAWEYMVKDAKKRGQEIKGNWGINNTQ